MSRRTSPWCRSTIAFLGDLEQVLGRLALLLIAMAAVAYHVYGTWTASFSGTRGPPDQMPAHEPPLVPSGGHPQARHAECERVPALPEAQHQAAPPTAMSTPGNAP